MIAECMSIRSIPLQPFSGGDVWHSLTGAYYLCAMICCYVRCEFQVIDTNCPIVKAQTSRRIIDYGHLVC
jgi:hypothetical protein